MGSYCASEGGLGGKSKESFEAKLSSLGLLPSPLFFPPAPARTFISLRTEESFKGNRMLQITEKKNDVGRSRSAKKTLVLFVGLDEASEVSDPFCFVIVKEKKSSSLLIILYCGFDHCN